MTRWRWPRGCGTSRGGAGGQRFCSAGWPSSRPPQPADLAPGFELSAAVLRHLQADPLLPVELLPDGWPGPELRQAYERWDRRYREVLTIWGAGLTARP